MIFLNPLTGYFNWIDEGSPYRWLGAHTWANHINSTPIIISGQSITGTNASGALSISSTWNTTGSPIGLSVAITNTASGNLARVFSLSTGGIRRFAVNVEGGITIIQSFARTSPIITLQTNTINITQTGTFNVISTTTNVNFLFSGTLTYSNTTSTAIVPHTYFGYRWIQTLNANGDILGGSGAATISASGISLEPVFSAGGADPSPNAFPATILIQLRPTNSVFKGTTYHGIFLDFKDFSGNFQPNSFLRGYDFLLEDRQNPITNLNEVSAYNLRAPTLTVSDPTLGTVINHYYFARMEQTTQDFGFGNTINFLHGFALPADSHFHPLVGGTYPTLFWAPLITSSKVNGVVGLTCDVSSGKLVITAANINTIGTDTNGIMIINNARYMWGTTPTNALASRTAAIGFLSGSSSMIFEIGTTTELTLATSLFTLKDGLNIVLGTTTGTKFGTATNQKIGFFNKTPVIQPPAYTPTNVTTDRSYNADSTSLDEIADVLGTLIVDLQSLGLVA